jgi:hypothetical protein
MLVGMPSIADMSVHERSLKMGDFAVFEGEIAFAVRLHGGGYSFPYHFADYLGGGFVVGFGFGH